MKISALTDAALDGIELELAEAIHAGFPSPAADYAGERIDLVREMNVHPESTFYARVSGDSMLEAGIFDGDVIVIDRSLSPKDGDFVIVSIDGEFMLKEYRVDANGDGIWLIPHNEKFQPVHVSDLSSFVVWGVVTFNVHRVCTHS